MFAYAATREQDERFKEIDEMSAALLRFPDARLAGFTRSAINLVQNWSTFQNVFLRIWNPNQAEKKASPMCTSFPLWSNRTRKTGRYAFHHLAK